MKYRKLGRSGIEVSTVCLGGWSLIGDLTWGEQDERDSIAAIRASLDAGVNFFDTAEMYGDGRSEVVLGKALGARRKDVVIASKVTPNFFEPATLRKHVEDALDRLGTDYLDLFQLHWPSPDRPIAETLGVLEELKAEGKIRVIGVSNFGRTYLTELLAAGRAESNQLNYSLLFRAIEHEVEPLCVANDVSILCYCPLCQGLLTGKFKSAAEVPDGRARTRLFSPKRPHSRHKDGGFEEGTFEAIAEVRKICDEAGEPMGRVSLAWLLAQPGVTSVVVGARNAGQASENARAADLELSPVVIRRLARATDKVRAYVGRNADMWQTESRLERPVG
jgi:aryl-alcohol dehydrogenase-like predicted oxidoreductase